MCVLSISQCIHTRVMSRDLTLCDNGRRGFLCVGPNTPSGMPVMQISKRSSTGSDVADVAYIVPSSLVRDVPCQCDKVWGPV